MASFIVGVFRDGRKIEGYRILSITGVNGTKSLRDIKKADLVSFLNKSAVKEFANAKLSQDGTDIEFTQGASSAYPILDSNGVLQGSAGITILYSVTDDNGVVLGYGIADTFGQVLNVTKKKLLTTASRYRQTNWEVYTLPSGERNIRPKAGSFFSIKKSSSAKTIKAYNSATDSAADIERIKAENAVLAEEIKKRNKEDAVADRALSSQLKERAADVLQKAAAEKGVTLTDKQAADNVDTMSGFAPLLADNVLPNLRVSNLSGNFDTSFNKDSQIKLAQIKSNLVSIAPFYASMIDAIPKTPTMDIPTIGVTEDHLYYNPEFLAQLSVEEATFIYIHEMLHIAMQHPVRHGKRDNILWNIACDLYINESICKQFGCEYDCGKVVYSRESSFDNKTYHGVIATPREGIFLSTIGESLDFAKDTAESIYARLVKENPNFRSSSSDGSGTSGGGNGGESSDSDGQSNSNSSNDSGGQTNGQGSQSNQSGNQGSQSGNQGGQGNQSGNQGSSGSMSGSDMNDGQGGSQQDDGLSKLGKDASGSSSNSSLEDDINIRSNGAYRKRVQNVEVVYNGKVLRGVTSIDIGTNRGSEQRERNTADATGTNEGGTSAGGSGGLVNSADDPVKSLKETKDILTRIRMKKEIDLKKNGGYSLQGMEASIDRDIEFALTVSYNWQQVIRKLCKTEPKKKYTLGSPNMDYANQGMTVATRQRIGRKTRVEGLKICVDVSGSVGDAELHQIFSKIKQILDSNEVDAEMIYWDTTVTNVGNFTSLRELLKIDPTGCGGTDPRCFFDYLIGRTKFQGKSEEHKPKDISGVIIFTDGCIPDNYEEYKRYFGSKTYWVIDDESAPFFPLFGKVLKARLK